MAAADASPVGRLVSARRQVALRRARPAIAMPTGAGEPGADAVVDAALYRHGERVQWCSTLDQVAEEIHSSGPQDPDQFVWIGLHEPGQHQFESVARYFDLHPLAVEDALSRGQRAKLDRYGDTVVVAMRAVHYQDGAETAPVADIVSTNQIMVFTGPGFVVTVRHGNQHELDGLRESLEREPKRLAVGPMAVLHAVVDTVTDAYLEVAADLQEDVDQIEAEVFSPSRASSGGRIYQLKREILEFRRAAQPLQPAVALLAEGTVPGESEHSTAYFRDVQDHLNRAVEQIASMDELLNSILQANLAQVSVSQNEDMRKISAWVAIAAVPTMLAGIYGMNFDHMPELHWTFGYPALLAVMAGVCLLLYRGFRRNGWL